MKFRPAPIPKGDPHPEGHVEWVDNWLSNGMAWVSHRFLPKWCQTSEHWTARLTAYLFTDCPCCLMFRGIVVGATMTTTLFVIVLVLGLLIVSS